MVAASGPSNSYRRMDSRRLDGEQMQRRGARRTGVGRLFRILAEPLPNTDCRHSGPQRGLRSCASSLATACGDAAANDAGQA